MTRRAHGFRRPYAVLRLEELEERNPPGNLLALLDEPWDQSTPALNQQPDLEPAGAQIATDLEQMQTEPALDPMPATTEPSGGAVLAAAMDSEPSQAQVGFQPWTDPLADPFAVDALAGTSNSASSSSMAGVQDADNALSLQDGTSGVSITVAGETSGSASMSLTPTFVAWDQSPIDADPGFGGGGGGVAYGMSNNNPPVAEDDGLIINEDTQFYIEVLDNDFDPDADEIHVSSVGMPAHGTATLDPTDDTILYMPDPNWNGEDQFTYEISDGYGGSDEALVTIGVDAVNDLPVAVNDTFTIAEDDTVTMTLVANDTDIDEHILDIIDLTNPAHGTIQANADQTVTYWPNPDFNGPDSFTYMIWDGHDGEATATVYVNVTASDDVPIAYHDVFLFPEQQSPYSLITHGQEDTTQEDSDIPNPQLGGKPGADARGRQS